MTTALITITTTAMMTTTMTMTMTTTMTIAVEIEWQLQRMKWVVEMVHRRLLLVLNQ